uniref:Uncharacterized protein n=1 Tax=Trichobilharzia regenti TaxID=157069 RepID=A0AA85J2G7_TRIRE|nr:unnamed protein product [Trichobilharzia regenti]
MIHCVTTGSLDSKDAVIRLSHFQNLAHLPRCDCIGSEKTLHEVKYFGYRLVSLIEQGLFKLLKSQSFTTTSRIRWDILLYLPLISWSPYVGFLLAIVLKWIKGISHQLDKR